MKRDMDLIRRIAIETEAMPARHGLISLDGVDPDTFATHVIWMQEAGLLSASVTPYQSDDPPAVYVHRLTWAGCEFLDAARSDTTWKKVKDKVVRPGMSFTFDVIKEALKAEITQGFPTARAVIQGAA